MSSRFVSGGTTEQPRERNELWQKAEQELEAARLRKEEQKNHDGKTLFEVLQENKAAKQEAFEEAAKLKHQFRSLDEDDVSFLNGIRQAEEAKQREVEKQTLDQLQAFRRQQEESGAVPDPDPTTTNSQVSPAGEALTWAAPAKKRKREAARGLKGVKVAKTTASTDEEVSTPKPEIVSPGANKDAAGAQTDHSEAQLEERKAENDNSAQSMPSATTKAGPMLGLGDYSSDDD